MPVAGLSLVGFLDQAQAREHLRNACVLADSSDAAVDSLWASAKQNLGTPVPNAGNPNIQPIPPAQQQYIAALSQQPWIQPSLASWAGATFCLVEIKPLLAFQLTISQARSAHHCGALGQQPTVDQLLNVCLPNAQANEQISIAGNGANNSILLRAESLNVRSQKAGMIQPGFIGLQFGISLPLVHVVRFNGRCYLHNGFHRALGVSQAGATHLPCLFRDVNSHQEVGIQNGATFSAALLESGDPPTLAHFVEGHALPVQLRKIERYINVSWAEYSMAVE